MFGWRKKDDNAYRVGERKIYSYDTGNGSVSVDPMILYKRVMDNATTIDVEGKAARSQHSKNREAHDNFIACLREVFSVKPLEQGGLTQLEVVALFDHFMGYVLELKKNSSQSQTLSNSGVDSPTTSAKEDQPTVNSSDSGSIAVEPTKDDPAPSPVGSPSLSA